MNNWHVLEFFNLNFISGHYRSLFLSPLTNIFLGCIIVIMISTGVICIKTLLMENKKLQILDVSHNQIGNEGVAAVCQQLYNYNTLSELSIWGCGLTAEGIMWCLRKNATFAQCDFLFSQNYSQCQGMDYQSFSLL